METGVPRKGAEVVVGEERCCEVPDCGCATCRAVYDGERPRFVCPGHIGAVVLGFVLAGGLADAA